MEPYERKDGYALKPICIVNGTNLEETIDPTIDMTAVYIYKCGLCGTKYSLDSVTTEEHVIENDIDNFGIDFLKDCRKLI
ncbi:hypothetical protein GWN26_00155 [Candidatus Saccharibacteria bacterium]|nr:hypothetical protein [Candidatus Saccharibacteria bacterium]NIW79039.1 hypothetical protein [Calditrichia bacterium]